jgi:ABC-type uncharacterized transport system involved in gliding motility auxiliary subunit
LTVARVIDFLAPLGVLVLGGALVASRYVPNMPGGLRPWLIVGGVLILAHLLLRWEDIARAIGRRQLRHGGNSAVLVVGVLAILAGVNYVAYRRPLKKDLTKGQRYSLSDQTKKVVEGLKDDVGILYFQRTADVVGDPAADRVREYQALSPHVKAEFVDPVAKPARAREYDARGPYPLVIVERGGKRERAQSGSEQDLTNALIKITREGKKTVCFAVGEGERDIDDSGDGGLSAARDALSKSQYETRKVLLAREAKVPEDCTVMVVAGPETDMLPPVAAGVAAYVRAGGKALVLTDPPFKTPRPNVDGLLKQFDLEAGADVVVDVSGMGQLFGTSELTPIAADYPPHEITRGFRVMTAYHEARSVQAGAGGAGGVTAQNLVQTSPASWAETDLTLKAPIKLDEGKDKQGPVTLAAVATVTVAEPAPSPSPAASPAEGGPSPSPSPAEDPDAPPAPPRKEGRMVGVGDSDFASNALLGFQGNRDFFLNLVAWLAQDSDLISVRPREPEDQKMFLTGNQRQAVVLLALLGLPGAFLALGVWSWWKRR